MPEGPLGVDRPGARSLLEISVSFSSFHVSKEELNKLNQFEQKSAFIDFLDSLIPEIDDSSGGEFEVRDVEVDLGGKSVGILTNRRTVTSEMLLDIESWLETEIGPVSSVTVVAK